ncbi:MAG TPA: DUF6279 family lipoprotein [Burkholderiales bacterium]|nr:DUF6279 family lipoprotein [Burkholderiales bacterium]
MHRLPSFVALFFLACLTSCATLRLSYDHADWLATRAADRYVDLTDDQIRTFKTGLSDLHAWHRERELPIYAQAFDDAARRLERGMSRADVEWAVTAIRGRVKVLGQRAADELAPVLLSLNDQQLREMEVRFDEDNRKFVRTQLQGDPNRLLERRADWLSDRIEDWIGRLTPAQRTRVRDLVAAFPDMPRWRLEERKRRQGNLLTLVRSARGQAGFETKVQAFLMDPDAGRNDASRQTMARWEASFVEMLVDLDHTLSPEQRRTAVKRLRRYAADFRALSAEAPFIQAGATTR